MSSSLKLPERVKVEGSVCWGKVFNKISFIFLFSFSVGQITLFHPNNMNCHQLTSYFARKNCVINKKSINSILKIFSEPVRVVV